jgi:hypothetical protein
LLREEVEARITAKTMEIFHRGKLVATHLRSLRPHQPYSPSTCRVRTVATATGRTNGSCVKPPRSATTPRHWPRSSCVHARILSRGSAPASASSPWQSATGKSWLACALGHKACREGFSVLYRRAPRLFAELATARGEGRLPWMLATLECTRPLIIDDWGPEPLNAEQRRDLLEIVEDRYDKGSLLVTSQIPVSRWHELIADPTVGDAILDRVVHRAHPIELKGPSLRKRHGVSAPAESNSTAALGG